MYGHKLNFLTKNIYSGMAQRIELFRQDEAFSRTYNLAPPPTPSTVSISLAGDIEKERQPADLGGGGEPKRPRESLVLYKSSILSGSMALGSSAAECTFVKVRKAELRLLAE